MPLVDLTIRTYVTEAGTLGCQVNAHVCTGWFCREAWRRLQMEVPGGEVVKGYRDGNRVTWWEPRKVA